MSLAEQHPIPPITDIALEMKVFTHKSVAGRPSGLVHVDGPGDDYESLAFLGDNLIALVVSAVLQDALPLSRPGDLAQKRALLVNQDRLASWADTYNLMSRVRVQQSSALVIRQNVTTKSKVFQAYIGALFLQSNRNYLSVEDWFGRVVEKGLDEIQSPENAQESLTEKFQTLELERPVDYQSSARTPSSPSTSGSSESPSSVSSNSPIPSSPNSYIPSSSGSPTSSSSGAPSRMASPRGTPMAPPMKHMGILALFNQMCAQRGLDVHWECTKTGKPHRPTHRATVRASPSGDVLGVGVEGKINEAKTKAAEEALEKLGWNKAD